MIRILNVTKSTGGLAVYNYRLSQHIDKDCYDWHVLCLSDGKEEYASKIEKLGHTTHVMEMERYSINILSDLGLLKRLVRLIQEHDYDIVVGHGSKAGFLVRIAGRITHVPAIYGLASMSFLPRIQGRKAHLYRVLEYMASFLTDGHIVTLSKSTRKILEDFKLSNQTNTSVIYTGVDLNEFKPSGSRRDACEALGLDPERPVIGWAARFVPQKAPLVFIDIIARVIANVPDVQIFMAGNGALKEKTIQKAKQLSLADNVIFADWQTDVVQMFSAFDVYVLNSRWEGLPQSLLEAMAMGCACVASNVDGNAEVIEHNVNGFLHPVDDVTGMADNIAQLIQDNDLRRQYSTAARRRIEMHFSIELMVDEWKRLFVVLSNQTD